MTMDTSAAVYEAVCAAVTQDPTRVQAATQALEALEKEPGTFNVLYSIAAQRNLPLDVRKLAIIRMKNVGVSSWRRRRCVKIATTSLRDSNSKRDR